LHYDEDAERRYPGLYMQSGQNLIDEAAMVAFLFPAAG
jgi:hypothetical protein